MGISKEFRSYNRDGLSSTMAFWLYALLIAAVAGLIGYITWAGFNEAAHNRVKEGRMWNECIAAHNPALECRIAIHGGV